MIIVKNKNYFLLYFLLITFFCLHSKAKNYDGKTYICADEIGPLLKFSIPNFENDLMERTIKVKLFNIDRRNLFTLNEALIQKKISAADKSYYFYTFNIIKDVSEKKYFEFYPPSSLLLSNGKNSFSNLVCWQ